MRILALAAAMLWARSPAWAQGGPGGGGPSPEMRGPQGEPPQNPMLSEDFAERLAEKLQLSDGQKAKVSAILSSARPGLSKRAQDIKDLQNRMRALHEEMRKAVREVREKIRAELDGEQKERFDSMRPPAPSGDGGRGGMRRRPGPPESGQGSGGMGEGRDMPPPEMWREPGQSQGGFPPPPNQGQ